MSSNKKVIAGQYVSDDGFKIDGSFPNGNFFSQDGIYPSAIGQAVIANEFIKVINKKFQTQIPLINLTVYSKMIF
jgi:exosome complex RNA-binding protein Rrp4